MMLIREEALSFPLLAGHFLPLLLPPRWEGRKMAGADLEG